MPTGSGNQTLRYNTRERALSSDQNRSQSFAGKCLAEMLRFMLDASAEEDTHAGAVEVMSDGTGAPKAAVFAGLRPRPEIGTVNLFIEPGEILIVDTFGASSDDSTAGLVSDPGVQTAGVLTLTAGSGTIRIDVIECQRVNVVTEVDNRDVFNPATGLFTPAQVDKVITSRLAYRIRLGTPGSGFPGVATGWVPLAVAKVSAAAATWNDVIMWDVRPLISDRWNAPFNNPLSLPQRGRQMLFTDVITNAAQRRAAGVVEAAFKGYRAGGRLGLTDENVNGYFDYAAAANYARNFVAGWTADTFWYVYAVFPFDLPRWVRYSDSSSGARVPVGQRGILCVTKEPPNFKGIPAAGSLGVNTPTATGLQDTNTDNAICLFAGQVDSAGSPAPYGIVCDGTVTWLVNVSPLAGLDIVRSSVSDPTWAQWTLTDNTTHPAGVRALHVRMYARFTTSGAFTFSTTRYVQVSGPDGAVAELVTCHYGEEMDTVVGAAIVNVRIDVRIPLSCDPFNASNSVGLIRTFKVRWSYSPSPNGGVVTVSDQTMQVLGWEMGP